MNRTNLGKVNMRKSGFDPKHNESQFQKIPEHKWFYLFEDASFLHVWFG